MFSAVVTSNIIAGVVVLVSLILFTIVGRRSIWNSDNLPKKSREARDNWFPHG